MVGAMLYASATGRLGVLLLFLHAVPSLSLTMHPAPEEDTGYTAFSLVAGAMLISLLVVSCTNRKKSPQNNNVTVNETLTPLPLFATDGSGPIFVEERSNESTAAAAATSNAVHAVQKNITNRPSQPSNRAPEGSGTQAVEAPPDDILACIYQDVLDSELLEDSDWVIEQLVAAGASGRRIVGSKQLSQSCFSRVDTAQLLSGDDDSQASLEVAVKHCQPDDQVAANRLAIETRLLAVLKHPGIVPILAAEISIKEPWFASSFMKNGNLHDYLNRVKQTYHEPTNQDMVAATARIASAMQFLEELNIVLADLTSQNVLVGNSGLEDVRIHDFASARPSNATHLLDKYCVSGAELPFQWIAPEVLLVLLSSQKKTAAYSHGSDSWAFAVTAWEIFSLGATPYGHLNLQHVASMLASGDRLGQPRSCPNWMFNVMTQCWSQQAQDRPSFIDICKKIRLSSNRVSSSFVSGSSSSPSQKVRSKLEPVANPNITSNDEWSDSDAGASDSDYDLGLFGGSSHQPTPLRKAVVPPHSVEHPTHFVPKTMTTVIAEDEVDKGDSIPRGAHLELSSDALDGFGRQSSVRSNISELSGLSGDSYSGFMSTDNTHVRKGSARSNRSILSNDSNMSGFSNISSDPIPISQSRKASVRSQQSIHSSNSESGFTDFDDKVENCEESVDEKLKNDGNGTFLNEGSSRQTVDTSDVSTRKRADSQIEKLRAIKAKQDSFNLSEDQSVKKAISDNQNSDGGKEFSKFEEVASPSIKSNPFLADDQAPKQSSWRRRRSGTLGAETTIEAKKASETAKRARSRSFKGIEAVKCSVCSKSVYAMEKLEADGVVYHKTCFRCSECNKQVSAGSYAALQGKIYCKPHFKKLFKLKGNYDEGFGSEQHKNKWIRGDNSQGSLASMGSMSPNSPSSPPRQLLAKAKDNSQVPRRLDFATSFKSPIKVTSPIKILEGAFSDSDESDLEA